MKLVNGLRALALTAFIFSTSCATDGVEESVETVEEENQIPSDGEEAVDVELPTAEAASVEAEQGVETIDANSVADVQGLPSDQQIAIDEAAAAGIANGAGQEIVSAPIPGAEDDSAVATDIPVDAQTLPESSVPDVAPVAEAEAPMVSPEMTPEEAPAIPTLADVAAETAAPAEVAADVAPTKAKGKKSKRARKMPELSGNEKMYIVQPGDTLAAISAVLYGTTGQWQNIANLNGIDGQALIFPGDAIKYVANEKTAAFESKYDGLAKASVAVEKGDTLSKIASRVMGNASYWKMLWRWNEAAVTDPNKIAVGMSLQYVSPKDLESVTTAAAH